jgi:hypothetical protein
MGRREKEEKEGRREAVLNTRSIEVVCRGRHSSYTK